MFPSQTPLAVPRDQFLRDSSNVGDRKFRWGQIALLAPGGVVGAAAWWVSPAIGSISAGLLTVTSILTGFTFAMANTFWARSIDARRDPRWAVDGQVLDTLDETRNHMVWTVAVGVVTVAILGLFTLFGSTYVGGVAGEVFRAIGRVGAAVASGLVFYVITLVAVALYYFNRAVSILKA